MGVGTVPSSGCQKNGGPYNSNASKRNNPLQLKNAKKEVSPPILQKLFCTIRTLCEDDPDAMLQKVQSNVPSREHVSFPAVEALSITINSTERRPRIRLGALQLAVRHHLAARKRWRAHAGAC
jgi:hypothetical protein